ncbi:MAG: DUF4148 domain-containing protein [Pseudomonadota bacterium]
MKSSIRTYSAAAALAVASLTSTVALADDEFAPANNEAGVVYHPAHAIVSQVSRAQVKQETRQARADGALMEPGEDPDYPEAVGASGTSQALPARNYRVVTGEIGLVFDGER